MTLTGVQSHILLHQYIYGTVIIVFNLFIIDPDKSEAEGWSAKPKAQSRLVPQMRNGLARCAMQQEQNSAQPPISNATGKAYTRLILFVQQIGIACMLYIHVRLQNGKYTDENEISVSLPIYTVYRT